MLLSCSIFKPKPKVEAMEDPKKPPVLENAIEKPAPVGKTDAFLIDLLQKDNFIANIIQSPKEYNAQIIYTKIDRDNNNQPKFSTYSINADPSFYFYPASMVKMPIAFLALQKINELREKGILIDKDMTMITSTSTPFQTAVLNDPTTIDGRPTIANYIKKVFLVSDNDASNRLYEFLGQEYINSNLPKMGYKSVEILHRLSLPMSIQENRITNPIKFLDQNGKLVYEQPAQVNTKKYSKRKDYRGVGYISAGKIVEKPFDFSEKNRISLNDMNDMLMVVIFPQNAPNKSIFKLTDSDRQFLLQFMSQLPSETVYPAYDPKEHWDSYVKFNLYGSEKKPMSKSIRVFNKVGFAYGYITDVSYIVDFENDIEFVLSTTIYVNKDGIFNDDKYETDDIALPFMKKVGEIIYNYEKTRTKNKPDLSGFKLVYEK